MSSGFKHVSVSECSEKEKKRVKKNSSKSKDKLLVENVRAERSIYKKLSTVE